MSKFFHSNIYHLLLGALFAVSTFVCFATPIGGSFNDVITLKMNNVANVTPVKMKVISLSYDSLTKKFYNVTDLYGTPARVLINSSVSLKLGDNLVAECSYMPTEKIFNVVRIERINPLLTFPLIQGLGELGRNMLFHVPMSFVAFIAFLIATVYSIQFLRTKKVYFDHSAWAASSIGLLFTTLATVTGSIWARFSWGSFWSWDPRETSIFILLLIYLAYFLLRSLLEESHEKKARLAAVYNIIAFVTVPFLMFVLPRITQSLHPGSSGTEAPVINLSGKTHTDPILSYVLWTHVTLFTLLFWWMKDLYTTILRKENE
ncbi:MAG: cytochrome c biogenesis protein CcsA [bacterium]